MKKVNTYLGCALGVAFFVAVMLMAVGGIPWGFIGFGVALLTFAITNGVLWSPIARLSQAMDEFENAQESEKKLIEENLRKQQASDAQEIMAKLDQIKKTVIVETHTSKDTNDAMNRGVVGALLFGATGAIVGTATAEEKSFTTFLIIFDDNTRTTQSVENGSTLYKHYIKFLDV